MTNKLPPSLWLKQRENILFSIILLLCIYSIWLELGNPFPLEFWFAVSVPILHQTFVWLAWRTELNHAFISKNKLFKLYLFSFFLLFTLRFVSLFYLGLLDQNSLILSRDLSYILCIICLCFGLYTMYCVVSYFGFTRAAGADHFDKSYRELPFVKKGIFAVTNNAMYGYAFLNFWAIAFAFNSQATLLVAAFSHLYIWLFYFYVEKPDINYIYGQN